MNAILSWNEVGIENLWTGVMHVKIWYSEGMPPAAPLVNVSSKSKKQQRGTSPSGVFVTQTYHWIHSWGLWKSNKEVNMSGLCMHKWVAVAITVARVVRTAMISEKSLKHIVGGQSTGWKGSSLPHQPGELVCLSRSLQVSSHLGLNLCTSLMKELFLWVSILFTREKKN